MLIDDSIDSLESMSDALELNGYKNERFNSPYQALASYNQGKYQAVIIDYIMPQMSGLQVIDAILAKDPNACVIVVSGMIGALERLQSINGICGFFRKPVEIDLLLEKLSLITRDLNI
jgi:DNA-binding NtrC family response regulator